VSAESMLSRMKTNHSSFELIPEEGEESIMQDNTGARFKKLSEPVVTTTSSTGGTCQAPAAPSALTDNKGQPAQHSDNPTMAQAQQAAMAARFLQAQQNHLSGTNLPELALHQQLFGHQLLQQKILEEQLARNRDFFLVSEQAEREKHAGHLGLIFHQAEAHRKAKEAADLSHHEKMKLEILKQKARHDQSAVASPEVKKHLADFVLAKKRKEASAVSMSNLKMVPTAGQTAPPHHALLRKTASESNLLKMKHGKRSGPHGIASPYQRASGLCHQPAIPENEVQGGSLQESPVGSAESSGSGLSPVVSQSRPMDLGSVAVRQEVTSAGTCGSAPTSPKTMAGAMATTSSGSPMQAVQTHPLNLASGLQRPSHHNVELLRSASSGSINSRSLPNIPSAMGRPGAGGLGSKEHAKVVGRRSPPASSVSATGASKQMLVRRSKSSAILPLRKHLIEKTIAEQQQKVVAAQAAAAAAAASAATTPSGSTAFSSSPDSDSSTGKSLSIRPIEEVMEEDSFSRSGSMTNIMGSNPAESNAMEVDSISEQPPQQAPVVRHFAARLGPAGLSPLVIGEVSNAKEYLNKFTTPPASSTASQSTLAASSSAASTTPPGLGQHGLPGGQNSGMPPAQRTGIGFDPAMLRHECNCTNPVLHPENPRRLQSIWSHLVATGLADQCVKVAREATLEEIRSVHSEAHTIQYGVTTPLHCTSSKFQVLPCGGQGVDSDTYWNENYTSQAAKIAAGTVLELSTLVARGELKNGFALVRPPGHHAEYEEAMGFCYFNSVAVAAKQLIARKLANRVLIIDWAIHHGNGTQHAFYENPNVLYISLHRHDHGNFYPGTGSPIECGNGPGLGFNINIAWAGGLHTPMADAEYLAAFRAVVLPIAHSFEPDLVLVSAGFDAAVGHPHPIGGYSVSTACFALLTLQLRQLANGKVVLALEGGFNEEVLNTASEQCLSALLGGRQVDKISPEELARRPNPSAVETLQKTIAIQSPYWEVLRRFPEAALLSHFEAWEKEREQTEALRAMASLSMKQHSMSSQGSSCSIVDDVDADSSMT